eukprot:TRINITY_DN7809_c0_g2_i10.p1 TRINITY_DN7809_c0_g2~~TRINITY_DN7809_c0_g2_i10.p1  ORF type:complete len:447 (-),score=149.73 TRINITY_DN7809_c0_g2_i10:3576-4916(-)
MRTITIGSKMEEWDLGADFTILKVLGVGGYGTVCQACHEPTKTIVAVKKIHKLFENKMDCKRILREISLLQKLHHPNIVKLHDILGVKDESNFNSIYLVMEYVQGDLHKLLKSPLRLDIAKIRKFVYNILLGLRHIHSSGVLHRDIKPANILINKDCGVRICDFGLARTVTGIEGVSLKAMGKKGKEAGDLDMEETKALSSPGSDGSTKADSPQKGEQEDRKVGSRGMKRRLSGHVVTRWYRAPEIILMEKDYGPAIDVWAAGCIFAELLGKMRAATEAAKKASPLFPGTSCFPISPGSGHAKKKGYFQYSTGDQLSLILDMVGTPTEHEMSFVTDVKALEYLKGFDRKLPVDLNSRYPSAGNDALDLLKKMLKFNPFSRITIEECLQHRFFSSIREMELEKMEGEEIRLEFEEEEDLDMAKLRKGYLKIVGYYNQLRSAGKLTYK